MKFFDCNACFNRSMIRPIRFAETVQDLLKEMDFYGIVGQYFFHSRQRDDSPVIDMHQHMGPFQGIYFGNPSMEEMLRTMDRCGVKMGYSARMRL